MVETAPDRRRFFRLARELERLARHVDALATVTWPDADPAGARLRAARRAAVRHLRALADELDPAGLVAP